MPSKYPTFDRDELEILPLSRRVHDMDVSDVLALGEAPAPFEHPDLPALADAVAAANERSAAVVLLMGAHVRNLTFVHNHYLGCVFYC